MKTFTPAAYRRTHPTRHPRFALRCADGCLSGSIASHMWMPWGTLPVRDYPYEGLTVMIRGENWKILDGFALRVSLGNQPDFVMLEPGDVALTPYRVSFRYRFTSPGGEHFVTVSYYLMDRAVSDSPPGGDGTAGCISICCDLPGCTVSLAPLVDIRHMYGASAPFSHRVWEEHNSLWSARETISVMVKAERASVHCPAGGGTLPSGHIARVFYRLGSGFRVNVGGHPVPIPDERDVIVPGEILVRPGTDIIFACATTREQTIRFANWAAEEHHSNFETARRHGRKIVDRLKQKKLFMNRFDIADRAIAMSRFGVRSRGRLYPEAGGWWFRTPWFRDVFEGLYNSLEAVMAVFGDDYPSRIITGVIGMLDPIKGLIPNKLEESGCRPQFLGSDATLLAYMAADRYLKEREDHRLARFIMASVKTTIEAFESASLMEENGPPVLHGDGLISCPSWHSWTDGKRMIIADGLAYHLAIRIPESWEIACIRLFEDLPAGERAAAVEGLMDRPLFFLPEINAQWIRTLRCFLRLSRIYGGYYGFSRRVERILALAKQSFRSVFLRTGGWLNSVVSHADFPLGRLADETVGSPQVVAVDLLSDALFTGDEIKTLCEFIIKNCLVLDHGNPFGLPVRKSGRNIYFGDNEYHEEVLWPRDVPYLIRLLIRTGRTAVAECLIKRHLDRQDSESVIFFNPELYSLGDPVESGPVPVKNPMQWWSQWIL